MSEKPVVNNYNGIGAISLLGVAFVVLKLTGYIHWSWWLVLLPFWGGLALLVAILILVGLGWLIVMLISAWIESRGRKARRRNWK